jgi:hypothetical protein
VGSLNDWVRVEASSAVTSELNTENVEASSKEIIAKVNIFFNFPFPLSFSVLFSYAIDEI